MKHSNSILCLNILALLALALFALPLNIYAQQNWSAHVGAETPEFKDLARNTESVTIDVSPIKPDCTGGHEFVIKMK